MYEQISAADAFGESSRRSLAVTRGAAVAMRSRGEIGAADGLCIAAAEQILNARPIRPRSIAENAVEVRSSVNSARLDEWIFVVFFVARGDCLDGRIDERDLRREEIAKQAGDTPRYIDPRAANAGGRQHFDAGDTAARRFPDRPAAHECQALRNLLAAGAQSGAAPEIDDDRARHLAVVLQMRAHDFVGGEPAEVHGGRRRQRPRIGGEEITAGG